jgi:adenosylmethionine-8-amino-7-oxononanoate aminotransferase
MQQLAARFKTHPNILDVRQTGMIVALELVKNKASKQPFPWQDRRGLQIHRYALSKGVLLRPLGDVVYFMPPYVINAEELALMFDVAWAAIEWATAD